MTLILSERRIFFVGPGNGDHAVAKHEALHVVTRLFLFAKKSGQVSPVLLP